MQSNFCLSQLMICLALTTVTSAKAAERVSLQHESFKNLQQQFQLLLPDEESFASSSPNILQFIRQRTDENRITHIRLQQQYSGFDVYGGYAVIHSKNKINHRLTDDVTMNGSVYRGLQSELGEPAQDFVGNAALALQQFKAQYQGMELSEEYAIPIVYIDAKHQAHWAYKVSVYIRHDHKIPERPTAIIAAKTYKLFAQWNDIKTATRISVKGMGFGGNNKTGQYVFGKTYPLLDLLYDDKDKICYMENAAVKVIDMEQQYSSPNTAMRFDCKKNQDGNSLTFWTGYRGDGYDKENGAFSPTNDAMYSGEVIKRMYRDWYGVDALAKKGKSMRLIMRVHYGEGYENAYWDGKRMTFGDGDSLMYPLVSLGITAHEISHGFTEQNANLAYRGQAGALNESFSDMAAQTAEFYATGKNSWLIGSEIMKEDSGVDALRYMGQPSRDGRSIDSASQYRKGMDVHFSSGVFNRLFYLMATNPGWDPRKAFAVMVKANMDYWTPDTHFEEAGCGILSAAQDQGFSVDEMKQSLRKVGIKYDSCALHPSLRVFIQNLKNVPN